MNQKEIVNVVAREIVDRFKEESKNKKIKVLILVNEFKGIKQFIENLFSFDESDNFDFHFSFLSDRFNSTGYSHVPSGFEKYINILNNKSDIKNVINDFDAVLITDLTVSQLSSASNLIINDEVTNAVSMCVFNDIPLYAGTENFDLIGSSVNLPYPVRDAINQNLRNLAGYNVKLVQLKEISGILKKLSARKSDMPFKKKVITREDINDSFSRGLRKITMYPGDIITALARDEAQKYNIEIIKE